jgi:hypothetical protein
MPAVAEVSATAPEQPTYLQKFSSNSVHFAPVVIHPDRSTSAMAVISSSIMEGFENGKNSFLITYFPLPFVLRTFLTTSKLSINVIFADHTTIGKSNVYFHRMLKGIHT